MCLCVMVRGRVDKSARALRWTHDSDLTSTLVRSRRHGRGLLPLVCVRLVAIPQGVSAPRGPLLVRAG